jgi:membrane protein YqaA with SNARE-associated domain
MGIMIHQQFNPTICIITASLGNTLGGVTSYTLGYLGKWEWLEKYFGIKKEKIGSQKKYADKYGSLVAFFSWLPVIGDPLAVTLGFFKVPFLKVLFWMALGKFLRYFIIYLLLMEIF